MSIEHTYANIEPYMEKDRLPVRRSPSISTNKEPHSNTYATTIGKTHVFTLHPLSVCLWTYL